MSLFNRPPGIERISLELLDRAVAFIRLDNPGRSAERSLLDESLSLLTLFFNQSASDNVNAPHYGQTIEQFIRSTFKQHRSRWPDVRYSAVIKVVNGSSIRLVKRIHRVQRIGVSNLISVNSIKSKKCIVNFFSEYGFKKC